MINRDPFIVFSIIPIHFLITYSMQKLSGTALETLLCESLVRQLEEGRGPNLLPQSLGNDLAVTRNTNIYETHTNLKFKKNRTRIFVQGGVQHIDVDTRYV